MNVNVMDLGACGDGVTLDTGAIQAAIDHAAARGGGRVTFPAGFTFLSGSLVVRAKIELHLQAGAALIASPHYRDYDERHRIDVLTGGKVDESVLPRRAFIAGFQADDFSITGPGEIHGNADGFIETRGEHIHEMRAPVGGRSQYLERPFTIFLIESPGVHLREFTLRDPAFWAIRLTGCDHSRIHGIQIHTDLKVPNADGIDIDRCRDVDIRDCELITADDCISLKTCAGSSAYGPVRDVRIANCHMVTRSGAITLGTESADDITQVRVSDCTVEDSHRGFAVRPREGGTVSDVVFRDSSVHTRTFDGRWWGHGEALHVTAFAWNDTEHLGDGNPERLLPGRVHDVVFDNLTVRTEAGVLNWAQDDSLITDITYRNVAIHMHTPREWPSRIDLRPNDVSPVVNRAHNAIEIVNCQRVTIENCSITWDETKGAFGESVFIAGSKDVHVHELGQYDEHQETACAD
jgi:hypothetical protein